MNKDFNAIDLLIVGGGISGLWSLAQAQQAGLHCLLVEKDALGAGQTIASQGIIHGGLKFSLNATLTRATQAISDMPKRWQQSLQGNDAVNLQQTKTLSPAHYFVPTQSIDSQLISFLGSKLADAYTQKIALSALNDDYHQICSSKSLYQLNEFVIDVQSLLQDFLSQYQQHLLLHQFDINRLTKLDGDQGFHYQHPELNIKAKHVLVCAGADYQASELNPVQVQKRPLHMVMMKGKALPKVYAHFITHGSKPLLTVTSHPHNGEMVWYMGGDLAEKGIHKNSHEQINEARKLLTKLVPSIDLTTVKFGSFMIDRAEPKQSTLLRPDDAFVSMKNDLIIGWPTKLAFAPRFADRVLDIITPSLQKTAPSLANDFTGLPKPTVANYPWEDL